MISQSLYGHFTQPVVNNAFIEDVKNTDYTLLISRTTELSVLIFLLLVCAMQIVKGHFGKFYGSSNPLINGANTQQIIQS